MGNTILAVLGMKPFYLNHLLCQQINLSPFFAPFFVPEFVVFKLFYIFIGVAALYSCCLFEEPA
ncbi:MAG: hypothetical protein A3F88_02975 [Deltaproteobacteria bacterium RIFCSPLOWO2_12_FULL_42_16]|nr:MAG: hypothetical protein A3H47_04900 [Deltaproteobacteria bacterium RIFCSPLOWO2_02_FULL_42_39]OGQ65913.1 MAG: hypothetical protein A3F88_02975 [Deltaproteobacteria bacterium RIFCSPLOWO2_12_FULL_42_16]